VLEGGLSFREVVGGGGGGFSFGGWCWEGVVCLVGRLGGVGERFWVVGGGGGGAGRVWGWVWGGVWGGGGGGRGEGGGGKGRGEERDWFFGKRGGGLLVVVGVSFLYGLWGDVWVLVGVSWGVWVL